MTPIDVATTIPPLPAPFVEREHVNMTIDTMLAGTTSIVVIPGADGSGKTTLLNSYARSRPNRSAALFLRPIQVSYDPNAVISELASQFRVSLGLKPFSPEEATRAVLAKLIQRLVLPDHMRDGPRG
jgi:ABC-type cobalamin/Fe3+-siderophores transport system ATPase subunit